jgi:hypothetical protein
MPFAGAGGARVATETPGPRQGRGEVATVAYWAKGKLNVWLSEATRRDEVDLRHERDTVTDFSPGR